MTARYGNSTTSSWGDRSTGESASENYESSSRSYPSGLLQREWNQTQVLAEQRGVGLDQEVHDAKWYQQQCHNTVLDSIKTAAETNEISQAAAEKLNSQSDQLHKIQNDVSGITHNLETSQYLIQGMKSWWGSVMQIFYSPPQPSPASSSNSAPVSSKATVSSSRSGSASYTSSNLTVASARNSNSQTTLSTRPPYVTEFDSTMDQNLDVLSDMLSEIQSRAIEVGKTLEHQNQVLSEIQGGIDKNAHRMAKQQKDMDRLLKRR